MNVLGRLFLNSCKDRRKDGAFLWDVEELTFLKNEEILLTLHNPNVLQKNRTKSPLWISYPVTNSFSIEKKLLYIEISKYFYAKTNQNQI